MKLKQQPEDFQVEERTHRRAGKDGAFALYLLEKRSLGTLEAIQAVCRQWKLEPRRVSFGGLKDRHALTRQYVTIQRGPHREWQDAQLTIRYLGQLQTPYTSQDIEANRFRVTLRDLSAADVALVSSELEQARLDGWPNYFDDQRFGSVGPHREFVARKLIDGDYEAALRLVLIEPYEFDRAAAKAEKRLLARHWGEWRRLEEKLPRGDARNVVRHLVAHPGDFRGGFARLRADLKSLYVAAYQSFLWNQMLARWLEPQLASNQRLWVELRLGRAPLGRELSVEQRRQFHGQRLPLPSARLKLKPDDPLRPIIDSVLQAEGLELSRMKLKHIREPFFSRGEREAFVVPAGLKSQAMPDERHPGRQKLLMQFELPRGVYATMLVKRITAACSSGIRRNSRFEG